ncbi:MAG: hypothetical protein PF693_09615 [Spirochaetia bacterium]|jgi:hypothetical protein|nr:hypothetical protein [Spirochaetia bacterium]
MTLQAAVNQHLFNIVLITLFFYGIVPIAGAFFVRNRWRRFRNSLMQASLRPSLSYKAVHGSDNPGLYRFFGSLQAIQDDNILWIANSDVSVSLDLEGLPLYILPSATKEDSQLKSNMYPDESPQRTSWNSLFSLPEKTSIFVSGEIVNEGGRSKFSNSKENPLLVVIYDCEKSDFYSHAILSGRQRNEYWNVFTPGTLTAGSFSLFIYFYLLIQMPYMNFIAVAALSFSLVPVMPFLPPGLFFYYIYRYFWSKARILRAERDLLKLPLNFFQEQGGISDIKSVILPGGNCYQCYIKNNQEDALSIFNDIERRASSLKRVQNNIEEYYVFGLENNEKNDPMAETLIIPGNPYLLSQASTKTAQKYELISVISFALGFLMNLLIFLTTITIYVI